jgi:uncharacterized Zn-binding protein involved in type VI secretion
VAFAAKQGDVVTGTDVHVVLVPSPGGPVPTPVPLPFSGTITGGCSPDVLVEGRPAAVLGSTATCSPPHVPWAGRSRCPRRTPGRWRPAARRCS